MSNHVVKVRRDVIAECMTCPLCNKLFRDATTISECLHTFCRKCIRKKLLDEELECCPVCNIDLGCTPLEKLRPDHNLQDVRANIFPFKRRKVKAPEIAPSVTLPARRKERSLSSLVVNTPRVSPQTPMTGKRSKAIARKASSLRGSSFPLEKPIKKEEDSAEDLPESSSSPETFNKVAPNFRQNSSNAETSSRPEPEKGTESGAETWEAKVDLWKPLNYLVEIANRSKTLKYASQGPGGKSETRHSPNNEPLNRKTKVKEHGAKSKVQEKKDDTESAPLDSDKPKKLRRNRPKKATSCGDFSVSPQTVLDAGSVTGERKTGPIWFSLVASEDQEGQAQLPQISASYLRIKDGNMPVSFIQKYLMRKLALTNEDEVEIKCLGQSVLPTLQLNNLVDLWLQSAATSQRVPASIGSSAKDFVMVLAYARKFAAS